MIQLPRLALWQLPLLILICSGWQLPVLQALEADKTPSIDKQILSFVKDLDHRQSDLREDAARSLQTLINQPNHLPLVYKKLSLLNRESTRLESAARGAELLSDLGVKHDTYFLQVDKLFTQLIHERVPHRSAIRSQQTSMRQKRHEILVTRFTEQGAQILNGHLVVDDEFDTSKLSLDLILQMSGLNRLTLKKRKRLDKKLVTSVIASENLTHITLDRCQLSDASDLQQHVDLLELKNKVYVLNGAFLGIYGDNYAARSNLDDKYPQKGALVQGVNAFPALETEMKPGDVITHIDDIELDGFEHLLRLIGRKKPGELAKFRYFQFDHERAVEVSLKLGERP